MICITIVGTETIATSDQIVKGGKSAYHFQATDVSEARSQARSGVTRTNSRSGPEGRDSVSVMGEVVLSPASGRARFNWTV